MINECKYTELNPKEPSQATSHDREKRMSLFKGKTDILATQKEQINTHSDLSYQFTSKSESISEQNEGLQKLKKEINKIFSSSHLSFLFGAGASMPAIPSMQQLSQGYFCNKEKEETNARKNPIFEEVLLNKVWQGIKKEKNLESYLELLYGLSHILEKINKTKEEVIEEINNVKKYIFDKVNTQSEKEGYSDTVSVYENFYKKIMYRESSLSKINIFTTNYDLFNEKAMDNLGVIFCNGFSGNIHRHFNPMTFDYAYAEQIGLSADKYTVIDKYVYLYKLHGSINWIEESNNRSFYKVKEVQNPQSRDQKMMIYPTPTKQSASFSSPYSDLFRGFQKKLMVQDSILVVIGYSFSDEHVNTIIYQALATIPKFRLIIFAHEMSSKIEKLKKKTIQEFGL